MKTWKASLVIICLICAAEVSAESSGRTMKLGDTGNDVRALQVFLNKNSDTKISESGPGSRGNETTYFGVKTLEAVKKFQLKFASEILWPAGLFEPTGIVGRFSLQKINSLIGQTGPNNQNDAHVPTNLFDEILGSSSELTIALPSSYSGSRGDTLSFLGSGFSVTEVNTVHFGNDYTVAVKSLASTNLSFIVPATIPIDKYDVWVSNSKGVSNKTFYVVKDRTVASPAIVSVTPTHGAEGQVVTISGSSFTSDNEIRTSYGIISHVASQDGKTISFTVQPDSSLIGFKKGFIWTVTLYVVNKNGVTPLPATFVLEL
ncbi:peptidoglycan-binding protein [Candidatus Parcubacteria bacterium]|nr:peptidoglycan-binding protein [Candidatus Parcubacteria bacterium]